jgi:hypothetical protein
MRFVTTVRLVGRALVIAVFVRLVVMGRAIMEKIVGRAHRTVGLARCVAMGCARREKIVVVVLVIVDLAL